jgi:trimethylamine:corrinoid methyltransferase-like protein
MQPNLQVLAPEILPRVIDEAIRLLRTPGVKVGSPEAINLLHSSGAQVNMNNGIVQIPEELILKSLETAPHDFYLYNADGIPTVHYSDNRVHFDPGSSGVHILDSESLVHRPSKTEDLRR